jgi:membrane-associated protease RseP (regulator of RpoE activity)
MAEENLIAIKCLYKKLILLNLCIIHSLCHFKLSKFLALYVYLYLLKLKQKKEHNMKNLKVYSLLLVLGMFMSGSCAADPEPEQRVVMVPKKAKVSLGVWVSKVDQETLDKYNLTGGAEIQKVFEGTEAERIGLKKGDIIVNFAGQEIKDPDQLKELIGDMEEEGEVQIEIVREGKRESFQAKLKPTEIDDFSFDDFHFEFDGADIPPIPEINIPHFQGKGGFLGVKAKDISDQLKDYFEVEYGALIEKVIEESPAEKAGLKAGDVIIQINDREIKDYEDLIRTLNYYNPDEKVKVKYSRKGKENTVEVVLGEKKIHKNIFHWDGNGNKFWHEHLKNFSKEMKIKAKEMRKIGEGLKDMKINIHLYAI